jgi:hypothetical protein
VVAGAASAVAEASADPSVAAAGLDASAAAADSPSRVVVSSLSGAHGRRKPGRRWFAVMWSDRSFEWWCGLSTS